ncbi:MAG: YraN family protein [candidate division Zixibacteria bacterium]|nr:YraN family protein [candidate division Zixibacteria bacterium]MDH3938040.1 YraN family protein [candidate division Zixibacteria bacterium]MDH4033868.1 YraN family protein [candidate division Zixibacteria bacterium]
MSSSDKGGSSGRPDPAWRGFEKLAARFFEQQGYEVLARNWRAGRLEIDLIVKREDLIVFVEVKSAASKRFGHPAERIDAKKTINLTRAAQQFITEQEVTGCDLRFDVVTFIDGQLEHFPNAFEAQE